MSAAALLSRFEHIRRAGDGWRADCPNPAHSRVKGSLSITEADDGRVLLHCFACHDVRGILGALGLELADLFPERIRDPSPETQARAREAFRRSGWVAALGVLAREASIVLAAAGTLRQGQSLTGEDDARLTLAMDRIGHAREVLL